MMASSAKAIFDILYLRNPDLDKARLREHLFENLRIDENDFTHIDFTAIAVHLRGCRRPAIRALRSLVEGGRGNG